MTLFEAAKSISIISVYEYFSGSSLISFKGNVPCLFHSDTKPSMHLYEQTNSFYCFSCKKSGTVIDLVMKKTGIVDASEAAKFLCSTFQVAYEDTSKPIPPDVQDYYDVYDYIARLYNFFYTNTTLCPDDKYFQHRGIDDKLVDTYLLGYCPPYFVLADNTVATFRDLVLKHFSEMNPVTLETYGLWDYKGDSVMADRYVFPIHNSTGHVVAFSGRSLNPALPKYVNTSETIKFKKKWSLYNFFMAKSYGTIYVVEGFMDALSLVSLGKSNVVATMGTSFTPEHLEMLKGKVVILSFDNDNPGYTRMYDIICNNKQVAFKVFLNDLNYKDFNEYLIANPIELKDYLESNQCISAPEFIIKFFKRKDLSDLSIREDLWLSLSNLIGANDRRYLSKYPINTLYSPIAYDYYWTIVKRLVKGSRCVENKRKDTESK